MSAKRKIIDEGLAGTQQPSPLVPPKQKQRKLAQAILNVNKQNLISERGKNPKQKPKDANNNASVIPGTSKRTHNPSQEDSDDEMDQSAKGRQAIFDSKGIRLNVSATEDDFETSFDEDERGTESEPEEQSGEGEEGSNYDSDFSMQDSVIGFRRVKNNLHRTSPNFNYSDTIEFNAGDEVPPPKGRGTAPLPGSQEEAMQVLSTNPHLGSILKDFIKEGIQEGKQETVK